MASNYENLLKKRFLFIFLFHLTYIKIILGQCYNDSKIIEGSLCFNRLIKFDNGYRAGQFTIRKDGVLLIEYSFINKRLFYGLKKNGRGFFLNEATNKEIIIQNYTGIYPENSVSRYESKNILVYLSDDSSKEKPYIFSVSSFISSVELHYFDNEGNNSYKTWLNLDFFNIHENNRYIFSYQFSLLEGKNNIYYAVYIQVKERQNDGRDYSISYTLSKFKFLDSNTNYWILNEEFDGNFDDRIISALIYEEYELLAIFFIKSGSLKYTIGLHDLNTLKLKQEIVLNEIQEINNANSGFGIFFKAIYLQYEYSAFIFFQDGKKGNTLELKFLKIINENSGYNVEYIQ